MADETHPPEQHPEQKEEKKKGTLESVVSELRSFARKATAIGVLAAMPLAYNYIDPSHVARAAVTTGAFAASKATTNIIQEKDAFEGIIRNGFNGALLSYPIAEGFKGLNSLESAVQNSYGTVAAKTAKGAGMAFGLQPAITAGNAALNYGLGKNFREKLWPTLKKSFKLIAIPGIINVNWLYQFGLLTQMAVSGALSYLLNFSSAEEGKGNIKNLYNALSPSQYISAGFSATGKLVKNTVYGFSESIYAIGSGLRDTLYKSAPKPESPEPATPPH